jgi:hypothetical protein
VVYPYSSTTTYFVNGADLNPIGLWEFSVPVTLNTSFQLNAAISSSAKDQKLEGTFRDGSAFASGTASIGYPLSRASQTQSSSFLQAADSSPSNGVYLGGIESVMQDGASIPFSVSSESGTNWQQSQIPLVAAVPEPSVFAMLVSGTLCLIGVLSRRTRQRHTLRTRSLGVIRHVRHHHHRHLLRQRSSCQGTVSALTLAVRRAMEASSRCRQIAVDSAQTLRHSP